MFIVSGGRGVGKTKALLDRVKENNGILVCRDPDWMRERAYKYGITGLNIMSYNDFHNDDSNNESPVYIHDINKFIKDYSCRVKGYSICIE